MKGTISDIKRMEIHDGDGLRTTVFFKGCPLKCIWCHNPESISFTSQTAHFAAKCMKCGMCRGLHDEKTAQYCPTGAIVHYGREYEAAELAEILKADEAYFKNSGGGVTLSGGECLAQPAFAVELARLLHDSGIGVYVDTCGYVKREVYEQIMPYTDRFLYDVKAADSEVHKRLTGRDNALILDNLAYLSQSGASIEIRIPLVAGFNDGEIPKIGKLLQGLDGIVRVKVLKYHNLAASRYDALDMENTMPDAVTTDADMEKAVNTLRSFGLNAVDGSRES